VPLLQFKDILQAKKSDDKSQGSLKAVLMFKNGKRNREIESESVEGKKLIKEGRVKYPKGGPVLILD